MNEDQIRIRVDFVNKSDAKSFISELRKAVTDPNLQKLTMRVNIQNRSEVERFLSQLQSEINRLSATKVTLQADYSHALKEAETYRKAMEGFEKQSSAYLLKKREYDNEMTKAQGIREQISALDRYIKILSIASKELKNQSDAHEKSAAAAKKAAEEREKSAERERKAAEDAEKARQKEAEAAKKAAQEIEEAERRAAEAAEEATERTVAAYEQRIGAVTDMLNAVVSMSSVFQDSLAGINSLFDLNIFRQAAAHINSAIFSTVSSSFDDMVTRYDILNTFEKYMNAVGVSSENAYDALDRVDQSIRGIPIGLDEAAQRLRRYQMFLDDIDEATNLTIGIQSAIFAGGANDQMRRTALYEIDRLLSAGDLATARQWNALIQGLGVSIRYLAEELNVPAKALPDMLATGTISAQEFLNALMELGKGESSAAQGLQELLNIYKGTIESWLSNIRFSVVRGGQRIGDAFNEGLSMSTGKGITDYLRLVRDSINDVSAATADFVRGNTSDYHRAIYLLRELFGTIDEFSASDTAKKTFAYMAEGIEGLTRVLEMVPANEAEDFLAYVMSLSTPMEKLLSMASGGTAVHAGVVRRFMDLDQAKLIEDVARNMGIIEEITYNLLKIPSDNALSEFISTMSVFGAPIAGLVSKLVTFAGWMQIVSGGAFGRKAVSLFETLAIKALYAKDAIAALISTIAGYAGGLVSALGGAVTVAGGGAFLGMAGLYKLLDYGQQNLFNWNSPRLKEMDDRLGKFSYTSAEQARALLLSYRKELEAIEKQAQKSFGFDEVTGQITGGYSEDDLRMKKVLEERISILEDYVGSLKNVKEDIKRLAESGDEFSPERVGMFLVGAQSDKVLDNLETYKTKFADTYESIRELVNEWNEMDEPEPLDLSGFVKGGGDTDQTDAIDTQTKIAKEAQELYKNLESLGSSDMAISAQRGIAERTKRWIDENDYQLLYEFYAGANAMFAEGKGKELAERLAEDADLLGEAGDFLTNAISGILNMPYLTEEKAKVEENLQAIKDIKRMIDETAEEVLVKTTTGDKRLNQMGRLAGDTVDTYEALKDATFTPFMTALPWEPEGKLADAKAAVDSITRNAHDLATGIKRDYTDILTTEYDKLTESEENAETANKNLAEQMDKTNSSISDHSEKVKALVSEFDLYRDSITDVINALRELGDMEVTPTVNIEPIFGGMPVTPQGRGGVKFNNTKGMRLVPQATGGLVHDTSSNITYGTDRVPTLLTPGEFVISRDAVKKYGVSLFDKLNTMSIGSMFTNMAAHLPSISHVNYSYSSTSNDNRQTNVNQYITTNNPDYSYRVASRFAYGLS